MHERVSATPLASTARSGRELEIRTFARAADLDALVPAWNALAGRSLEPAPSAEAWMLLPSLRHAIDTATVEVVTFALPSSGRLVGIFPLARRRLHNALPFEIAELWNHIYAVNATPLVDAEAADQVLDAFLRWTARSCSIVRFPELREDGELYPRLVAAISRGNARMLTEQRWERAFFRPARDADAYLMALGSAHHRKEWRRQERRLGEQGTLRVDALQPKGDLAAWLDEFVALEASGWKGRKRTAFDALPAHRAWLEDVARFAFDSGRLDLLALRFDGKPIAMHLSILAPPGAYAFKIAFDEAFVRYSPGVLLELENVRRLHRMPHIQWMDSLAIAGHTLMERVWSGRAPMQSMLVAASVHGRAALALLPTLRRLKQQLLRRDDVSIEKPDAGL
jgi:CelD/BcsL family acetyltransferase involved in cellulose biosynthesis